MSRPHHHHRRARVADHITTMTNSRLAILTGVLDRPDQTMVVYPWRDPVVERVGHDAGGDYVELFWLNSLGPTATWLLRRLSVIVVTQPDGYAVDLNELALALGLGPDIGLSSSFARSLGRLVMFGLARVEGRHLEVRAVIPPLPGKQVERLPHHLQRAHALWSDSEPHRSIEAGYRCGYAHQGPRELALRLGEVQRQIDEETRPETSGPARQPRIIGVHVHRAGDIQVRPRHVTGELG